MKIESHDTDIETLLTGNFFHIPRFQRPYSWDEENITDFWSDLIINKDDDYFIGSMVVYKKSKQEYGVVDGQQRLTTITILLCVIRDAFIELGNNDLAKGLHGFIERKDRDNKSSYVLKPETSFPYFQEKIQKISPSELEIDARSEELNLERAHKTLGKFINDTLLAIDKDPTIAKEDKASKKNKKLISIRNIVLNLNLIFVALDKEDDAYLIFETLNTRGKDLSLTDLAKNHFSKQIKVKSSVDYAKIKWQSILQTIHDSSVNISSDQFIYHFWASRYESIPLKKLFPKIKKAITKAKAKSYLDDFVSDAKLYRSIHETTYDWDKNEKRVAKSLSAFQLFKLQQPTPAVLSLVRSYREKKIKYKKLRNTLEAIEKFHFIFTAVTSSRSSGGISAMYSAFGRKLFEATDANEAATEISILLTKLKTKTPKLDEFKAAFREIYYTNSKSKQKNLVRYILQKFSVHSSYKFPVDFDDLTIEHLQPQASIGEGDWTEESIGRLGNLLFLDSDMNGELDTNPFLAKIKILRAKGYTIPTFINKCTSWSPSDIDKHTDEMAEIAYSEIWAL